MANSMTAKLILASASPRRKALLEQIGIQAQVKPVDIDESCREGEPAEDYVLRLAQEKAAAAFQLLSEQQRSEMVILAADTCVSLDHHILGKPEALADAQRTLGLLSGQNHQVYTGFALMAADQKFHQVVTTQVDFREISEQEIAEYWATGEPADKAGSYGIQGLGAVFVDGIRGSYSNVVGLPLAEVSAALQKFNIRHWQSV